MNEFLEQFVLESRELVAQASDGLLQLERSPQDGDCLDAVFRAFHTLKGGAGIVEFAAMERAVHAAEELLSDARAGRRKVTSAFVEGCLACLDQVGKWLDGLVSNGELPVSGSEQADALIDRLGATVSLDQKAPASRGGAQPWLAALQARHSSLSTAVTAVRYTPGFDCFYQGEDPVARMATLPQLLTLELAPLSPWPSLSELDPYSCNLILMALTTAPADAARSHMQGYSGECEILEVAGTQASDADRGGLSARARDILQSQLALLENGDVKQFHGRVASAGLAASNVLRAQRRQDDAERLLSATAASQIARSVEPLREALKRILVLAPKAEPAAESPLVPEAAARTLRVAAERIDALVRLTGELTTAKNALKHTTTRARAEGSSLATELTGVAALIERFVGELQQSILSLRVLPLRTVLQRFPRVLRDLSATLGKPVNLSIHGDHTEADKAIVEMLFEPLLHTLRNAIDHGVEEPRVRVERGKPLVASVHIRAAREDERVVIEVEDDGAGVDIERVRRVAIDRRIATAEELRAMDEAQVVDLVFAPGFSTAASVTEMSGRGVGLDAVRTAIERIGGTVSMASQIGQGTCVRFSLPFSVMMTPVMTVEAGGQTFGIPLDALVEVVRVPQSAITGLGAARVFVHRERTIPFIDLGSELRAAPDPIPEAREAIVVLATVAGEIVGFRVDRLGERMEVILKPLEGLLQDMRGITGTTLLGDGRVLLVLDLKEMLA